MDITLVSEPTALGKAREVGDIQEALLVFVNDELDLRDDEAFQRYLCVSIALSLGISIDEVRLPDVPEHLRRDGIKFVVSDAVYGRLRERTDGVAFFGGIVVAAIQGYVDYAKPRDDHRI
jgi:hypothetical protein